MADEIILLEEGTTTVYNQTKDLWDLKAFIKKFKIKFVYESEDLMDIEFDIIGVGPSIANAIRRVLLAEVPSMAIEKIYLYQNTSVIPDEVLCHRLGLLPVFANPSHFEFPQPVPVGEEPRDPSEEPAGDPKLNIVFELNVKCKKRKPGHTPTPTTSNGSSTDTENPEKLYENAVVRTASMKWVPIGIQNKIYNEEPLRMIHDDIVIAKLRPGQEIEARCHCVKGIGRDHAKFAPVATASYKTLPKITLNRTVAGDDALRLQSCFSKGVIEINGNTGAAFVKDARRDTCSRNIFQHEDLKDAVKMAKDPNYYIFSVESVGALSGRELTITALHVLKAKLGRLREMVQQKLEYNEEVIDV